MRRWHVSRTVSFREAPSQRSRRRTHRGWSTPSLRRAPQVPRAAPLQRRTRTWRLGEARWDELHTYVCIRRVDVSGSKGNLVPIKSELKRASTRRVPTTMGASARTRRRGTTHPRRGDGRGNGGNTTKRSQHSRETRAGASRKSTASPRTRTERSLRHLPCVDLQVHPRRAAFLPLPLSRGIALPSRAPLDLRRHVRSSPTRRVARASCSSSVRSRGVGGTFRIGYRGGRFAWLVLSMVKS